MKTTRILGLLGLGAVVIGGAVYLASPGGQAPDVAQSDGAGGPGRAGGIVAVEMPPLEGQALVGWRAFGAKCAACHGPDAGGVDGAGPPLVHRLYEPGHHGDMAIVLAARRGVTSHHWRFGDMPPVEAITDVELAAIVAFLRRVQQANGIF